MRAASWVPGRSNDHGFDLACDERVERVVDLGVAAQVSRVGVLLDVVLSGGALLNTDRLTGQILDRADVAALLDQEGLFAEEPRIREVDHPFALPGDGGAGDRGVELVQGEVTEDGVERRVLVFRLELEPLGDLVRQVDLEALVVGRAALFERRKWDVHPDDQGAGLEGLHLCRARRVGAAASSVVVIVAAGGERSPHQQEQGADTEQKDSLAHRRAGYTDAWPVSTRAARLPRPAAGTPCAHLNVKRL